MFPDLKDGTRSCHQISPKTAFAACLALGISNAAVAHPAYKLTPLKAAAAEGNFTPVGLTDGGVAIGTIQDRTTASTYAFEANASGNFGVDICNVAGLSNGNAQVTTFSPYSSSQYIAGWCNGTTRSFLWNVAGGTAAKVSYPGSTSTGVYGVSSGGLAVGSYFDFKQKHGFYLFGTSYVAFDPPGSIETDVAGLSPNNTVSGHYLSLDNVVRGYLLDLSGTFTVIAHPFATETLVTGLNSHNQAVGTFQLANVPNEQVFAWQDGNFLVLPIGASSSHGVAINEKGIVVGNYEDAKSVRHGFVWQLSSARAMTINGPRFSSNLTMTGINNAGQLTGYYEIGGSQIAFIATCVGNLCY